MTLQTGCHTPGFERFSYFIFPEGLIHAQLGSCYRQYPVLSRVVATPIAFLSGLAKVILFPVICLVGVVVMPILVLVAFCMDRDDEVEGWMEAWCFCAMGTIVSLALVATMIYKLNLITSSTLIVGLGSTSVIIHVYKLVKEPEKRPFLHLTATPPISDNDWIKKAIVGEIREAGQAINRNDYEKANELLAQALLILQRLPYSSDKNSALVYLTSAVEALEKKHKQPLQEILDSLNKAVDFLE